MTRAEVQLFDTLGLGIITLEGFVARYVDDVRVKVSSPARFGVTLIVAAATRSYRSNRSYRPHYLPTAFFSIRIERCFGLSAVSGSA